MNKLSFILKRRIDRVLLVFIMTCILVCTRIQVTPMDSLLSVFHRSYNERKFLGIYVTLYLLSILPVLKDIYDTNKVIRNRSILKHLQMVWKEICVTAGMFVFLSTVGWYIIVGSKTAEWFNKENVFFVMLIFVTQFIAWIEVGMLATFVYSIIRNLPITYVLCQFALIILNLSLYITNSEKYVQYRRIYLFMYDLQQLDNLQRVISVGFFHVAVTFIFIFGTLCVFNNCDFALREKRLYAEKKV